MFNAGLTYEEMAKICKCSAGKICYTIKSLGWGKRSKKHTNRIFFTEDDIKYIVDTYRASKSIRKIANHFGVSDKVISTRIDELGIPRFNNFEAIKKLNIDESLFDPVTKDWEATLLGWIASDGHNNGKQVRLVIHADDADMLRKFSRLMYGEDRVSVKQYKNKRGEGRVCYLAISRRRIAQRLWKIGITSNKTKLLRWPKELGEQFDIDFIRGYFDGDGSISRSNKRQTVFLKRTKVNKEYHYVGYSVGICGCLPMMRDIKRRLTKLGIASRIHWSGSCNPTLWNVVMKGMKEGLKFLDMIYANRDLVLERKYKTYLEFKKFWNSKNSHSIDN